MADTYVAEVTVGPLTYTGPTSDVSAFFSPGPLRYSFECEDFGFFNPTVNRPGIALELRGLPDGTWETREYHGWTLLGSQIATLHVLNTYTSPGTGAFTGGGTLRITKDETLLTYTFQGILGTSTHPFTDFTGLGPGFVEPAPGELAPDTLTLVSQTVALQSTGVQQPVTLLGTWRDFFGSKNGTHIKGATLASDGRGSWKATSDVLTPWAVTRIGNVAVTAPDTGAAIALQIAGTVVSGVGGAGTGFRQWDQTIYIGDSTADVPAIDMTIARDHGAIFAALVYPAANTILKKRSTYDYGATWSETDVVTGAAKISSPSISWWGNQLRIVYQEGTAVRQITSTTLAADWNTPMTLAVTGSNPRHVVDVNHGIFYYFLIAEGNLVMYRSGDYGQTFFGSPVTVVTGITTQTVGAVVAIDGSILVTYLSGTDILQVRSNDMGSSWS